MGRLIRFGENGLFGGWPAAINALAGPTGLFEGNAPHGGFGLFLDFGFAIRAAAPMREREAFLDGKFELAVILRLGGIGLAKIKRALEEGILNFDEQLRRHDCNSLLRG